MGLVGAPKKAVFRAELCWFRFLDPIFFNITQSFLITLNFFFYLTLNQLLSDGALQNIYKSAYPRVQNNTQQQQIEKKRSVLGPKRLIYFF